METSEPKETIICTHEGSYFKENYTWKVILGLNISIYLEILRVGLKSSCTPKDGYFALLVSFKVVFLKNVF